MIVPGLTERPTPRGARVALVDAVHLHGLGGATARLEALAAQAVAAALVPTATWPLTPLPARLVFDGLGQAAIGGPVDAVGLGDPGRPETADGLRERLDEVLPTAPRLLAAGLADAHGAPRHPRAMLDAIRRLAPHAQRWVLDADEVALLTGRPCPDGAALREGGRRLFDLGCPALLLCGGRTEGHAVDFAYDGQDFTEFGADRVKGEGLHGAKATLNGHLLAGLARGQAWLPAIEAAKGAVSDALAGAQGLEGARRAAPLAQAWRALGVDPAPIKPVPVGVDG